MKIRVLHCNRVNDGRLVGFTPSQHTVTAEVGDFSLCEQHVVDAVYTISRNDCLISM